MSKKFAKAFEVTFKHSIVLELLTFFLFGLAFVSCWLSGISLIYKLILLALLTAYVGYSFPRLFIYKRYQGLLFNSDLSWQLKPKSGGLQLSSLLPSSAILGPFFFLHFKTADSIIRLVLHQSNIDKNGARLLRANFNNSRGGG
ncbi:MAG: hypothetical protein COB62_04530 [Piscirickettsiaceae bacterium]|nr:MAG: hypothetical protein COB62_04530 [Piscirickettsiaceae bacterium]